MSDSDNSQNSESKNGEFLALQKEESDVQSPVQTDVSQGKDVGTVLDDSGELKEELKDESKEGSSEQTQESGESRGDDGGQQQQQSSSSSGGNDNAYPLPSEQKQLERDREEQGSNE